MGLLPVRIDVPVLAALPPALATTAASAYVPQGGTTADTRDYARFCVQNLLFDEPSKPAKLLP